MPSRWKDSEHLLRMAGLFGAGTLVFLIAQAVLVPADFGEFGHYRTGALAANRLRPVSFAGQPACVDCHTDVAEAKGANQHRGVRCEACHGPQARHAATGEDKPARPDVPTLCVRCHAASPARPASFPQVNVKEHAGGDLCTSCHTAHAPRIG
jgi:predicted CXXCH cytochrome family protein